LSLRTTEHQLTWMSVAYLFVQRKSKGILRLFEVQDVITKGDIAKRMLAGRVLKRLLHRLQMSILLLPGLSELASQLYKQRCHLNVAIECAEERKVDLEDAHCLLELMHRSPCIQVVLHNLCLAREAV